MKSLLALAICFAGWAAAGLAAGLPEVSEVAHTPAQPHSADPVKITARLKGNPAHVVLQYQLVDPGKYIALKDPEFDARWAALPMNDSGLDGDDKAQDGVFSVVLPSNLQIHRRLVRYRVAVESGGRYTVVAPGPGEDAPNLAYFVYDGVPAWRGAIEPAGRDPKRRQPVTFHAGLMRRVQVYHLISKASSVENATWYDKAKGKEYKYTGTLVSDGQVYDHIRIRARGGAWRYALGKNMWKFDFNSGHSFLARDDYGQPYERKWSKVNLRSCIQQGEYGRRGEDGMFESVGFRLFNLAGVESCHTHWVQLRIIDEVAENPSDQYHGDFWGLYLAIENEDGHFLKEHDLPDGNLYKMEGGTGTLSHQGEKGPADGSDLADFIRAYSTAPQPQEWWRTQLDLPRYYSFRSTLECIHDYDVGEGKNYDFLRNPKTDQWSIIPWDIDLTWSDGMYGNGEEPFKQRVFAHPRLRREYLNRLREVRDLLYNTNQTWQLIDECAAVIADPTGAPSLVDADRAKWDYHPMMSRAHKGGQGLFYQAAPTKDFAGMVRLMKDYVRTRSAWIDSALLQGEPAPPTPSIRAASSGSFRADRLSFECLPYTSAKPFAAMEWRLGEISDPGYVSGKPTRPGVYEITPAWDSGELDKFVSMEFLPKGAAKAGHRYRARARVKDATGTWSHWSPPVEFTATK